MQNFPGHKPSLLPPYNIVFSLFSRQIKYEDDDASCPVARLMFLAGIALSQR